VAALSDSNVLDWNTSTGNQTGILFGDGTTGNIYTNNRTQFNSSAGINDLGSNTGQDNP
jgi:hypothetical protein